MVKSRLCETARLAFFSARPRLSQFLNCKTETFEISEHCEKNRDSETSNLLKKRDWETLEIRLKFCETQIFWRTICHPLYYIITTINKFRYLYYWVGFDICTIFWLFYLHIVLIHRVWLTAQFFSNLPRELWWVGRVVMIIVCQW